jgi:hypothetical protein
MAGTTGHDGEKMAPEKKNAPFAAAFLFGWCARSAMAPLAA